MLLTKIKTVLSLVVLCTLLSACAELKEAGRAIGHTSRDAAKAIGHGTRDAAKSVARGTERVAKSVAEEKD